MKNKTIKYRSGFERDFHRKFPSLEYETTSLPYTVVHRYTPDWRITDSRFIETKGLWTGADRAKHLYIQRQHPKVQILIVFQEPNRRLSKNSKTTYAQWCEQHGLRWAAASDHSKINQFITSPL